MLAKRVERAAGRAGLDLRAEVGRLSRAGVPRRRRAPDPEPRREAARPLLPRAARAAAGAAAAALRARRRDRHRARTARSTSRRSSCASTRPHRASSCSRRRSRRRSCSSICSCEGDRDLRGAPFRERRARARAAPRGRRRRRCTSRPSTADRAVAADWFRRFEGAGLDGVMAKPAAGTYEPNKRVMFKVKHERDCDCVVAGFRWHKNGEGRRGGLAAARPLRRRRRAPARRRRARASPTAKRRELVEFLAPYRENALARSPLEGLGRREARRRRRSACRAGRAAGARARISRGSRCAPSSSSRSPTTTCRAPLPAHGAVPPLAHRQAAERLHLRAARGRAAARARGDLRDRPLSVGSVALRALRAPAIRASDRRPGRAFPVAGAALRGRCAGSRACGSRSTSGRASSRRARRRPRDARPTSGWRAFQRSSPASAASLLGEFATTTSGIFARGLRFAGARPLARDGATRGASPSILRKCGGQGASPRPAASSRAASSSSFSSEPAARVHRRRGGSPISAKRFGTVSTVKSAGSQSGTSSQRERRRHARVRQRPHRVRGAGRAILGVLVVVEEHAVALLLPPLRRRERRHAPLDLARQRERRAPHLAERPARLRCARSRACRASRSSSASRRGPSSSSSAFTSSATRRTSSQRDAGARIEIDAQLVGMLERAGAHRVRVQLDAAEVHDPGEARRRRRPRPPRRCGRRGTTASPCAASAGRFSGARFW